MPNEKAQNLTPEQLFKLWWVKLPMEEAENMKDQIMSQCGWGYDHWYNRINGRTMLSGAEKNVIVRIAGHDIFFIDQEGDAQQ